MEETQKKTEDKVLELKAREKKFRNNNSKFFKD